MLRQGLALATFRVLRRCKRGLIRHVQRQEPTLPDPGHLPFETVTIGTVFSGGGLMVLLGVLVKQWVPWRTQKDNAEQKAQALRDAAEQRLRDDLVKRVDVLEKTLDRERTMRAAEASLERHKINNLTQCLDAVLMVLEAAPEKTTEVVAKVRAMRDAQLRAEAEEAGAIHAAYIASKPADKDESHAAV
jgi:hypothetical protein